MPTQATIDIRTRFIDDNVRVYFVFPGDGYRYFNFFDQESGVFLQYPGFPEFTPGEVPSRDNIVRGIVVSNRVMEWWRDGSKGPQPERNPERIRKWRQTEVREEAAAVIENFFTRIQKGDVVIVPGPTDEHEVLFGEIVDPAGSCIFVSSARDHGELLPGRRVRWIARMRRGSVPRWLDAKLPSPNVVRQLERSRHFAIFDLMYARYYYDGRFVAKFSTGTHEFSTLENFLLNQIFLYVSALHESIEEGNIANIRDRSLVEVVSELTFSEDIPEQRILIQSPGFIVLDAKNIIPLLAGVLMSLASVQPAEPGTEPPLAPRINTSDDSPASAACVADLTAETVQDMEIMGYERWREVCLAEFKARQRTAIDPGMGVSTNNPHGAGHAR